MPQPTDIHDSQRDIERMQPDTATLDLPDVEDIPGQEHVKPPKMKQFADDTIASADEEGEGLFDDDEPDEDTDVTSEEKELLQRSSESMATPEDEEWRDSTLDNTDNDGDVLNEEVGISGRDLDIPGAEDDDDNEDLGEEDEENNSYSLGADKD